MTHSLHRRECKNTKTKDFVVLTFDGDRGEKIIESEIPANMKEEVDKARHTLVEKIVEQLMNEGLIKNPVDIFPMHIIISEL